MRFGDDDCAVRLVAVQLQTIVFLYYLKEVEGVKQSLETLKHLSKATLVKWLLFLGVVYAVYDAVYVRANDKKLMLDMADVSGGLVTKMFINIDLPLLVVGILVCVMFDRRRTLSALAIRTKRQMLWLVVGAVVFVLAVYVSRPTGSVGAYEIVQALLVFGFLEELIFRGLLFTWMDRAGCGVFAYLLSGLTWGAHYAIRAIVTSGTATLWAVLPVAIFGIFGGAVAAWLYKKSDSLWLVAYLHGALSLL